MYQIYADGHLIHDDQQDNLLLNNVKLHLEVNNSCSLSFSLNVLDENKQYLKRLSSLIQVIQENEIIFQGRIIEESRTLYGFITYVCEGSLAYFNDSIYPPFEWANQSKGNNVEHFLKAIIDNHNNQVTDRQKIQLGIVTVQDSNNVITRSSENYLTSWEMLSDKLFNSSLGGYMYISYLDSVPYLNYVSEFQETNIQPIEISKNILDMNINSDCSDMASAIIPIGNENLTIGTNPDWTRGDLQKIGNIIQNNKAIQDIGYIIKIVKWDDVNVPSILETKASEYLSSVLYQQLHNFDISALDLHLSDKQIQSIKPFRNILVNTWNESLVGSYPLKAIDIDISNPIDSKLSIGASLNSFTEVNYQSYTILSNQLNSTTEATNHKLNGQIEVITELSNVVQSNEQETIQTFTEITQTITNNQNGQSMKWDELKKYIRFSIDGIEIGSSDSPLKLQLDNDSITFLKNGNPIAYWNGTDLYTGNIVVEVNEKAQFGKFAFIPRSNGHLSFLKVRD